MYSIEDMHSGRIASFFIFISRYSIYRFESLPTEIAFLKKKQVHWKKVKIKVYQSSGNDFWLKLDALVQPPLLKTHKTSQEFLYYNITL